MKYITRIKNGYFIPAIKRRNIGHAVFPVKRMPAPEELLEVPVLDTATVDHDTHANLKGFIPPVLYHQLEASLSTKFNEHIVKTDWTLYYDPLQAAEEEQAARLLQFTLMSLREMSPGPLVSSEQRIAFRTKLDLWLRNESQILSEEMRSGDTTRWREPEQLIGEKAWKEWSEARKGAIKSALNQVVSNPQLHPRVKQKILAGIVEIIEKTID